MAEGADSGAIAPNQESRDEVIDRERTRARWLYAGFAIGIVLAFMITAGQVAARGWTILPFFLVCNLIWVPPITTSVAYNRRPVPRPPIRSWRLPRFRMRALMVLIAYVAIIFGAGVTSARIGSAARTYATKPSFFDALARNHRELAERWAQEARQHLERAAILREEKTPDSLAPHMKDHLRLLKLGQTPEVWKNYYRTMADEEEKLGRMQERDVEVFRARSMYFSGLAGKYARALRRPWIAVEPDPPEP